MSSRTRTVGIGICLVLLALMTWGKPLIATVIPPGSFVSKIGQVLLFGCGFIGFGLLLARWGIKQLYGAITQTRIECDTCHGSGYGPTHDICYNEEGDRISEWNDHLVVKRVQSNDCIICGGAGSLATGFFKQGLIGFCIGGVMVSVGLIILSGWREFTGQNQSGILSRAANPGETNASQQGETAPQQVEPGKTNNQPQSTLPTETQPATQPATDSQPVTVRDAGPGTSPRLEITLNGRETETSGNVWGIQGNVIVENTQVRGKLTFKLISIGAGSYARHRINSSATMDVVGTFDGARLQLSGTGVSDPTLIGVGRYDLAIDKVRETFNGTLPNGGGTLKGAATIKSIP